MCPKAYAHGPLASGAGHFLLTDFLHLNPTSSVDSARGGSNLTLAQKLAKLHSTPVPAPSGHSSPQFGFPYSTSCGSTLQSNPYTSSWADFYANHRLRFINSQSELRNGKDAELTDLIEKTAAKITPRLLRQGHLGGSKGIVPVVVHGDLWSGNHGKAKIGGNGMQGPIEDVVFDSSAVYGHSEYEFGIMKMFGGFSGKFWEQYHGIKEKDEPVEEFEDRVSLYEL